MRSAWAALVVVSGFGVYLLAARLLYKNSGSTEVQNEGLLNDRPHRSVGSDRFREMRTENEVSYLVQPQLVFPIVDDFEKLLRDEASLSNRRGRRSDLEPPPMKVKAYQGKANSDKSEVKHSKTSKATTLPNYLLFSLPLPSIHQEMFLNVTLFRDFIAPNFIVQHFASANSSWVETPFADDFDASVPSTLDFNFTQSSNATLSSAFGDFQTHRRSIPAENCIYHGHVLGQPESSTVLNLCRGLYGSLQISDGSYFIEPLTQKSTSNSAHATTYNQPHLLYKQKAPLTFHNDYSKRHKLHLRRRSLVRRRNDTAEGDVIRFPAKTAIKTTLRTETFAFSKIGGKFSINSSGAETFGDRQTWRKSKRDLPNVGIWSYNHFVEILVVADFRMKRYHGPNLHDYVLTLLSIVANIYRHPSLEASINIVLVRLVELDTDTAGPPVSDNAQETLKHFCRWQQSFNDADDINGHHHDAAILLTRHDICRAAGKCDTLGLAELGTMCDQFRSCAIIEDNGLSAAFTIAHELGHIFNIPHDDEKKCAAFMSLDKGNYHIMAPTLEFNTHPWSWSTCSARMLRKFLDSTRNVHCLRNKPTQRIHFGRYATQKAPGLTFDANRQCQFVFGTEASLCPYMPACKRLWCATKYGYQGGCRTQHMPWADGTPCHNDKWCYKGECVGLSPDNLVPVNGNWGNWGEWSECTRTCGGGVQKSARECDNPRPANGGNYCEGKRVQFQSCSTRDCPDEALGFREVQCGDHNGKTFGIPGVPQDVEWVPKYTGIHETEQCKLWCSVKESAAFYLLREKVTDGTPCSRYTDNMCINGECKAAGCDHRLESALIRDRCGVCGGDGTTCHKVSGSFNERRPYGYNAILKIPEGVTYIDIRQTAWNGKKDDDNYLALQNSRGEYILNGHMQVSVFQQEIPVRGTILYYSGSDNVVERINSSRPTKEDLYLHVLTVGALSPPDIRYEYVVSNDPKVVYAAPKYVWKSTDEWTHCSDSCQGSQRQKLVCIDSTGDTIVREEYCVHSHKPEPLVKSCNTFCQFRWLAKPMTECSALCGNGEQNQEVSCLMISHGHLQKTVDSRYCKQEDRPHDRVHCYKDCSGRKWIYSSWSTCTKSCDGGQQTRDSICVDASSHTIDERYCGSLVKDALTRECGQIACPQWEYNDWEECSHSCDGGVQYRRAVCRDSERRIVEARLCSDQLKDERRSCNYHQCAMWQYGEWSQCSKSCNEGVSHRDAWCSDSDGKRLPNQMCDERTMISTKACIEHSCPFWKIGDWSPCSQTCQDGWMTRTVDCDDGAGLDAPPSRCTEQKPNTHQQCNQGSCPFWRTSEWSECSSSCGNSTRQRHTECIYQEQIADETYCHDPKPQTTKLCPSTECPKWGYGHWQQCSASCGEGTQTRDVFCHFPTSGDRVSHDICRSSLKPLMKRSCESRPCSSDSGQPDKTRKPISYETGDWSECSTKCGRGTQKRLVVCRDIFGRSLTNTYCGNLPIPVDEQECSDKSECGEWRVDEWELCPISCGSSALKTRRRVYCFNPSLRSDERPPEDEHCDKSIRPANEKLCNIPPACPGGNTQTVYEVEILDNSVSDRDNSKSSRQQADDSSVSDKPSFDRLISDNHLYDAEWVTGAWTDCSKSCGGGMQRRSIECRTLRSQGGPSAWTRPESHCKAPRPPEVQDCSTHPCSAGIRPRVSWRAGKWSTCSVTCGKGFRQRDVTCIDGFGLVYPNLQCVQKDQPFTYDQCRMKRCPRWKKSPWSSCSASCGEGMKTRTVECRQSKSELLDDNQCGPNKPEIQAKCHVTQCPSYHWETSKWTACSEGCGEGKQVREVVCFNNQKQKAPPRECNASVKPPAFQVCSRFDKCRHEWWTGSWTPCSETCGSGIQERTLHCRLKSNLTNVVASEVPAKKCSMLPKPNQTKNCTLGDCSSNFFWQMGAWSTCSSPCGWGYERRRVQCRNRSGQRVRRHNCVNNLRPPSRRKCFMRNCEAGDCRELQQFKNVSTDGYYEILVRGFRIKIFCFGMHESVPREYLQLPAGPSDNFAEIYSKRLSYPFTCPYDGKRNENCDCSSQSAPNSGLTRFHMIRIDLYNMKIDGSDFRFAEVINGSQVAYGTAGDCYSAGECPQGEFSIDLRGTGFRISPDTIWTEVGHRAVKDISIYGNGVVVKGKCGGYCGNCLPDLKTGLQLEMDSVYRF